MQMSYDILGEDLPKSSEFGVHLVYCTVFLMVSVDIPNSERQSQKIRNAKAISGGSGWVPIKVRTKIDMRTMCRKRRIGEPECSSSSPRQKRQIQLAGALLEELEAVKFAEAEQEKRDSLQAWYLPPPREMMQIDTDRFES
eukprot:s1366_g4.t1